MKSLTKLLAVLAITFASVAHANDNTIRIVSAFPPGSGPDSLSRKVAEQMSTQLKVPVIIENRPGGNGIVAMNYVLSQKDNNNMLLYISNDNVVVYPLLSKDSTMVDKFRPLKQVLYSDLILAVAPGVSNIDALRKNKNNSYGSWSVGSAPHILGSELGRYLGYQTSVHVPYKDYGQWFADISNGTLSYSFVTVASTGALEKAGKIRYLATTASQRETKYPTLPTMQELTGQTFYGIGWAGFFVANSMPEAREKELKAVLDQTFGRKEVVETLDALNYSYRNLGVAEFRKFVQQEQTKYKEAFRKNNIKLD